MVHNENKVSLKVDRWADILLIVASLLLLFWELRGRWAQVTSEMFQNRDFFHPMIADETYFDKPLKEVWRKR